MTNKTILGVLAFTFLLLFISGTLGYSIKIPVCNSTLNDSCITYSNVAAIASAPLASMYLGADGNIYLTNDTLSNYTIYSPVFYNYTNITQNITYYYSYNLTNGSNLTIYQNVTANDTMLRTWIATLNLTFNQSGYNRTEADSLFASKIDLANLQNALVNYASKNDLNTLNAKFSPLLYINFTGTNGSSINLKAIQDHVDNSTGDFNMTWKVIIIINCFLVVVVILLVARSMMAGG